MTVTDELGNKEVVRKSTLIWCLSDGRGKLSNDRLRRVQGSSLEKYQKKQQAKEKETISCSTNTLNNESVFKSKLVNASDWCFFKNNQKKNKRPIRRTTHQATNRSLNGTIFGCILAFKFGDKKRPEKCKIIQTHVPVSSKENNVKVLGNWYIYNNKELRKISGSKNTFYLTLSDYLATSKIKPIKCTNDPEKIILPLTKSDLVSLLALLD